MKNLSIYRADGQEATPEEQAGITQEVIKGWNLELNKPSVVEHNGIKYDVCLTEFHISDAKPKVFWVTDEDFKGQEGISHE